MGRARPGSATICDGDGGVCGAVEDGRGAGDFEPVLVRGVMGRMMVGFGDFVDSRGTTSALGFALNVSTGVVGFTGVAAIGVLIVRCRRGTAETWDMPV